MKLVDMKISKAAAKEASSPSLAEGDGPRYPYGLSLTLDHDALDALGLDMPKVGTTLLLTALVDVTSCSMNEQQDQEARLSVGLQITDMALDKAPKGADASDALYGVEKK